VLFRTIVVFGAATLARALAPNYPTLLVLTAIAGLGIGGEYGVGQTLVAEVMPANRRGWYSGLLYGGIYIGIMLGAVVGGYVTPHVGWRLTFALSGLPVLFAIFVRMKSPESPAWEKARRERPAAAPGPGPARAIMSRRYLPRFLLCLLAAALQFFAYYGIATFLPSYLVEQGFSVSKASWWLFFTGIAGLVGCVWGSYSNDRFGRRTTLSVLAAVAGVSGLVLALAWNQLLQGGVSVILIPFFFFFVGSNGAVAFGVLFSEMFPTEFRTTAVSSALQVARGLSFFPPVIAGALVPRFGYEPVVYISAAEFLLLAALAWAFRSRYATGLDTIHDQPPAITDAEHRPVPPGPPPKHEHDHGGTTWRR
jgi:putative MFS transporter